MGIEDIEKSNAIEGSLRSSISERWTDSEERKAVLKVDFVVLLLLTLGLTVFQFDRMNLASALTGGFLEDVNVVQDEINIGNELMFLGIFLFEIPSNMLLMNIGPRKWLSFQVTLFGFVAIMQIFLKNRAGFYASRFMLGIVESGYIPGGCYILSNWYKKSERARRTSIYFFGMFGGYAVSPVLCSAILLLDGKQNIAGWRWIFLLEGLLTVLVAGLLLLFLPGSPQDPYPLIFKNLTIFTDRDIYILQNRLEESTNTQLHPINKSHLKTTLLNWRRYPHLLATAIVFGTWAPLTTYTPTILVKAGFTRIEANALTAIGGGLAVFVVFLFGFISDRSNQRGITVIIATALYGLTLIVLRQVLPNVQSNKWKVFGLWTLVNAFAVGYHPVQNTWLQLNCHSPQERSISIALWVMFAMIGLMSGSQLFRGSDAPMYQRGTLAMIFMVFGGVVLSTLQLSIYLVYNKRSKGDSLYKFTI